MLKLNDNIKRGTKKIQNFINKIKKSVIRNHEKRKKNVKGWEFSSTSKTRPLLHINNVSSKTISTQCQTF